MRAIRLRTEFLKNPMGIDVAKPCLMWNCQGGNKQTAWQIVTEKWDSGKVKSDSMRAEYPKELSSRERVNWKIRLWDENDKPGEWSDAFFEIGLLCPEDWKARWISGNYKVNPKMRYPADCFRREIVLNSHKEIEKARLYMTACGLYEAKLDGEKVGDFCLAPGYTDYRKRVQYQTYDVTGMLRNSAETGSDVADIDTDVKEEDSHATRRAEDSNKVHVLTVQLADGWYRGSCGAWGLKNQYGKETKLLAQLEIFYTDGTKQTVVTDENWQWSDDGPIRFTDNKDGEIVEAFRVPSYGGKAKVTQHEVVPAASNNVQVTEHERLHPVITTAPNGKKLLNFGQNIAGYVTFRVNAH
ncbi:MAG: alpha-L-rhamnosidase N-terminal domain-containing protein, partial [Eubacterium sp.]|nr:alpha-L-rhamnosidase N-terminal domain-containing protein [Eubacterium sp.]